MKLSIFYGLLIVSLVRGNMDVKVLQQVGDFGFGGGQGAEGDVGAGGDEGAGGERTTTSPPPVWCDPEQGWQQTPNGICYLIGNEEMQNPDAREYCRGLGHDIIEWSEATYNELLTVITNDDSIATQSKFHAGVRRTDGVWLDKDGNVADVSNVPSGPPTRHCVHIRKESTTTVMRIEDCVDYALPLCQWSQ